ncbi:lytic murein transglycosylase [Nocardioides sp. R-C-SC26]|uniref:lytic murein transglycosylase n=1 Tax=Nocardioides sp. R-C-SC26 TaxID=2870414 RepID=UPI001E4A82CC|nr:lytic murein transglycosylase [Nocardioides sp. R-C-SC26]
MSRKRARRPGPADQQTASDARAVRSVRIGRAKKTAVAVPIALLSAAWTASLASAGSPSVSADGPGESPTVLPEGEIVPAEAIEAPASVSRSSQGGESGSVSGAGGAGAQQIVATASTNGIPSAALAAYQRAESVINAADATCNLSWQLLAAIGRIESDHGRYGGSALDSDGVATPPILGIALDGTNGTSRIVDTDAGQYDGDTAFDRAVGPMQFIPSTWAAVGVDADNDGVRNPQDIDDAALASAVYLCSGDGDLSTIDGQRSAVFRYNHSTSYVDLVLGVMNAYLAGDYTAVPDSTVAAGYLTPAMTPAFADDRKGRKNRDGADEESTEEPTPEPTDDPTTEPTAEPTPEPQDKPKGITLPEIVPGLPQVSLPPLPQTTIKPVDDVLTLTQALVQCTLEGLIDNPFKAGDKFDVCIADYTGTATKD